MKKDFIHTSESVTEGHPDKLCDQISDAIVDRFLEHDIYARIIAECAVSSSIVFIAARFASGLKVDFPNVARKVIRRIGYVEDEFSFKTCSILTSLKELVPDQDFCLNEDESSDEEIDRLVAYDQVTLFGFSCNQSPTLMPLPLWLAHKLSRKLAGVRLQNVLPYLAPDGTTQVAVEYKNRVPHRIYSVTINSSQKDRTYPKPERLRDDIIQAVVQSVFADEPVVPDNKTRVFVNPGGPLKLGGPSVHSGLTGRKNAIDTYGGFARNSGSALSGKDPWRIDRVGAYAARYAAKNVVAAGLADQCEVQLSYSIGLAKPVSVQVETMGTGRISDDDISNLVQENFDFRLGGIVKKFDLRRLPSRSKGGFYRKLAAYGHFGRTDMELPWEATDKVELLKSR
ncbi:MAG: methionine adenosyltransferase [Desulfomonile tiedjei]|uniref:Methionine adenosyltransferase n=1 Tax=Desulfomonile tiedjei TaxID=2358 RepID=A0A9D6Z851_9BACT|nr:methionine adenosyltransferase [Desulfomonile tiedjei]